MSNKSRLQTNNTNLQALITKANNLPDAGGGAGGGDLETVTISLLGLADPASFVHYLDGSMALNSVEMSAYMSITVLKNSILVTENSPNRFSGCSKITGNTMYSAYLVTG